jgi:hypothetical protein
MLPVLAEDWKVSTTSVGCARFRTTYDTFFTKAVGVGSDGTGLMTVGLILDKITFMKNLSHKVIVVYAQDRATKERAISRRRIPAGISISSINTRSTRIWRQ